MPEADAPAARLPRYIQIFTPDEQPYEQTPVIASEAKRSNLINIHEMASPARGGLAMTALHVL